MGEVTTLPAVQQDQPPRLPKLAAGGAVRAIVPEDFEGAWRIANAVVKSKMQPRGIDSAEAAMVCILHGLEVGMAPMMALQSIAPINGRPAIFGDGALGLVQGSGLLEWHREHFVGEEGSDDFKAVCVVKRRNDPEEKVGEFSVADAKRAHLWDERQKVTRSGRNGDYTIDNDSPWHRYPKRMLKMRARSFALRDGFADVLRGLHIAEEAQDIPMRDVTPPASLSPPIVPDVPAQPEIKASASPSPEAGERTETWEDVQPTSSLAEAPASSTPPATLSPDTPAAEPAKAESVPVVPTVPEVKEPGPVAQVETKPTATAAPQTQLALNDAGPMPDFLRRGDKPAEQAEPAKAATVDPVLADEPYDYDVDQWLQDLEGAFGGCEELEDLGAEKIRLLMPLKSKISDEDFDKGIATFKQHWNRICGVEDELPEGLAKLKKALLRQIEELSTPGEFLAWAQDADARAQIDRLPAAHAREVDTAFLARQQKTLG